MWKVCFTVMVIVAMCLCSLAESESDMYHFPSKRPDNKRYCGSNLVKILQFLCDGFYNSNISPNNNYGPRAGRKKSIPGNFNVILHFIFMGHLFLYGIK
jgi:hypothetical protein